MTDIELPKVERPYAHIPTGELQVASQAITEELKARIAERRETCEHPEDVLGMVALERPPNIARGCTYCVTPAYSWEE